LIFIFFLPVQWRPDSFDSGTNQYLLALANFGLGIRQALPLLVFELAGYAISISTWGILLAPIQSQLLWITALVKIASSGYLAYTAMKVWRDARLLQTPRQRSITSKQALCCLIAGMSFQIIHFHYAD
jgi:threonine/homoserine/homoserine lactone efflux protein